MLSNWEQLNEIRIWFMKYYMCYLWTFTRVGMLPAKTILSLTFLTNFQKCLTNIYILWEPKFRDIQNRKQIGCSVMLWMVIPTQLKNTTFTTIDIQIRSNETAVWCVYEVKWVLFKLIFCPLKMLARPCQLHCSKPSVRAFKWGTVWHSTSRGIRTTRILS